MFDENSEGVNLADVVQTIQKECLYCRETKPILSFPKHTQNKDGYDNRCRICIQKRSRLVKAIKKIAPPKPELCECCGKPPTVDNGLVLDHDAHSINPSIDELLLSQDPDKLRNLFRGWIHDKCNISIGGLGDTIEDIQRVMHYLQRHKDRT